jgi:hypothetical protein
MYSAIASLGSSNFYMRPIGEKGVMTNLGKKVILAY